MEINRRIAFGNSKKEEIELLKYLQLHNIPYETSGPIVVNVLNILESNPHWETISKYIEEGRLNCINDTIFTKKELHSADWLYVRCKWRNGYPQPEDEYRSITYDSENFCNTCGSGLVQKEPFRLHNVPKWGQRNFMLVNWVEDELFVTDTVKSIFEKEDITGVSFLGVNNKNGTKFFTGIHQMKITCQIPYGFNAEQVRIREKTVCPSCGKKKYLLNGIGMHVFDKEIFNGAADVVTTSDLFGSGHACSRLILVRQRIYQTLMDNKLGRGLVFEPVKLI